MCSTSNYTKMMLRFVFLLCFLPNLKLTLGIDRKTFIRTCFLTVNVTELLVGQTKWFSQSEVLLLHIDENLKNKTKKVLKNGEEKYVLDWIRQVPKEVIPYSENGPLVVRHLLSINRLGNLDKDRQILELFGWQSITWTDVRLAWEDKKFIEVDEVIVPTDLVWKPDIILFNSAEYPPDFQKARARVTKNGIVNLILPLEYRSSCIMARNYADGDHLTCNLRLGSWNYDLRHIELQAEMDTAFVPFLEDVNRDWLIVGTNCSIVPHEGEGYPKIVTVVYQIELEKKQ